MLGEMKTKGIKEMEEEQQIFFDYSKFVTRRTRDLSYEIKTGVATASKLQSSIEQAEGDLKQFAARLDEIDAQAATEEKSLSAATDLRDSEHAKFLADQTDYSESLYALDRAIQVLASRDVDREQAIQLLQRSVASTRGMRRVLAALQLEEYDGQMPSGAPAVAAYKFQGSMILDMLKSLQDRFRREIGELEKAEMNSAHAYSMEKIHTENLLENLKAERQELAERKAAVTARVAAARNELAETERNLAADRAFLADFEATFSVKNATYVENQKVRKEEVATLGKAIEILSSPEVQEGYAKNIASDLKFVQVAATAHRAAAVEAAGAALRGARAAAMGRASELIKGRASSLKSGLLLTVSAQLAANPFAKVVELIEGLIARLKAEAAAEADHKAYCDEELKNNEKRRNKHQAAVARLTAEVQEKSVGLDDMAKEIKTLAEEQAALSADMTEATDTRSKEKAANKAAIEDAEAGQAAVKQAILVLKDFYSKQGAGFLQVSGRRQVPEMEKYTGMYDGGVVAMLEVIESDFARLEADTKASETQAQAEYTRFMTDAEKSKAAKRDAEFKLSLAKDQQEFEVEQLQKDLDSNQQQLDMAKAYYEELKPQCVEVQVSHEEREARRQEEIKALTQAYEILNEVRTSD